jgi:hypothetical protein
VTALTDDQRQVFITEPRLSKMLRDEIAAFVANPTAPTGSQAAVELIKKSWDIRLEVGRHILQLRRFAKQETLFHRWPDLARTLYEGGGRLIRELEKLASGNVAPLPEVQKIWDRYKEDESLLSLLRLRPLFGESVEELSKRTYQEALAPVARTSQPIFESVEAVRTLSEPVISTLEELHVATFCIAILEEGGRYRVEATSENGESIRGPDLRLDAIKKRLDILQSVLLRAVLTDTPVKDLPSRLKQFGQLLYDEIITGDMERALTDIFSNLKSSDTYRSVRINFSTSTPEVAGIPWECLYIPEIEDFWSLLPNASVVRHITLDPNASQGHVWPLVPPVQVFAIFTGDSESKTLRSEEAALRQVLKGSSLFDLRTRIEPNIPSESIKKELRDFFPVVLHASRTSSISQHEDYADSEKSADYWPVWALPDSLPGSGTKLVMAHDWFGRGFEALVVHFLKTGAQCVITATQRLDPSANYLYTREFYRALSEGFNVERAIVQARRALQAEGRNWLPYALFTSLPDISALQVELLNVKQAS